MTTQVQDLQSVVERLQKLEGENRTLKRAFTLLLVAVGCALMMGQAAPKSRMLEAEKLILTDASGSTRAELAVLPGGPALRFFNSERKVRALYGGGGLSLFDTEERQLPLASFGASGLSFGDGSKYTISLGGYSALARATAEPRLALYEGNGGHITLSVDKSGPLLLMSDKDAFQARLGTTDLQIPRTGESRTTSAASLILFDKKGNVIWRAP